MATQASPPRSEQIEPARYSRQPVRPSPPSDDYSASDASNEGDSRLTEVPYWDDAWKSIRLPAEVRKGQTPFIDAISDVFDRHLRVRPETVTLELGGAPGQWAAYIARRFSHRVTLLDYSAIGLGIARENFRLLGNFPWPPFDGDIFDPDLPPQCADVVYSLGLVEHFADLSAAVGAHVRHVAPNGILVIGCPNLRGLTGWLMKLTAPASYSIHNVESMRISDWRKFEKLFGLTTLEMGYIGGFEPRFLNRVERPRRFARPLSAIFNACSVLLNLPGIRYLHSCNAEWWSSYAIAVYRVDRYDDSVHDQRARSAR